MCGMRTAGLSTQLAVVTQEEDKMAVAVISETSGGQDDMEETEEPDREEGEEDEGLHYYPNLRFGSLRPNIVCSINVHFSPNIIFKPQPCPSSFISSNVVASKETDPKTPAISDSNLTMSLVNIH